MSECAHVCECTWDLGQSPHCTGGKIVTVGTQPSRDPLGSWVYRELKPKPRGLCLGVEIDMFVHMELWVVTQHHQLLKISHAWMVKMQIPTEHDSLRSEVQELHFKLMSR